MHSSPTAPLSRIARATARSLRLRPTCGFSLIEVLVAITLIGIGVAISIPKVARITNESKVQRAAQAIQMEVQQAFAIAGRNRSPAAIRWNSASMQLRVTNLNGSTVYRRAGLGAGAGYGLTASDVSVVPATLTVFPNGLAADTLVITLTKSGYSKTIRVSRSGMVRLK